MFHIDGIFFWGRPYFETDPQWVIFIEQTAAEPVQIGHGCHGFDVSGCAQSQAATSQLQTVEIFQREQLALIEEGKAVRAGGFHMISW